MRLLLSIYAVAILLTSSSLYAGAEELRIKLWHDAYGPGFEIQNKGNGIWIAVVINNELKDFNGLANNSKKVMTITGDEDIILGVYTQKPGINPRGYVGGGFVGSQPDFKYKLNAKGKTKYLTWNPAKFNNPAKSFYPQTGTFMGATGKSASGYSLGKNIDQPEIQLIK